jgi:hypothetical protein
MRQAINEAISLGSLVISALSGAVGMWGCPQTAWFHWIPVGFLVLGGVFGFVALWQSRWPQLKGYTEIANQEFLNQDIVLDGHLYLACKFTNVTFVYNGGDCGGFNGHCLFGGSLGFKTGDPKVGQVLGFLKEIRMLRPDAFTQSTPRKRG